MLIEEKFKIIFGLGKVGVTFQREKSYLIINKIDSVKPLQIGSQINILQLSKEGKSVSNSFILSGDLCNLATRVEQLFNSTEPKIIEHKNFILDFTNANRHTLNTFSEQCRQAAREQHINVIV